ELHRDFGDRIRMAQKEIAARLEGVVKMLHQRATTLFRKINQNVHAKNYIHASDVNSRSQIHWREIDHLAQPRLDLLPVFDGAKVRRQLRLVDGGNTAARIAAIFGML